MPSRTPPDRPPAGDAHARPAPGAAPEDVPDAALDGATEMEAGLSELAFELADQAKEFIHVVEAIAAGESPDEAVSLLLMELSGLLAVGSRLGAIDDIVPEGRWEPDAGREPDVDRLRHALRDQLEPVDDYVEVFDPYGGPDTVPARLSDDLAGIVSDLLHGVAHHAAGRTVEALWWWQYHYLASWGPAASAALRAVQSLVAHVRQDAPLGGAPDTEPGDALAADALPPH